ncbi:hypothetical protein [Streptomyces sp. G1]|uniref:hypothetical protein n=1 Tax=Streptomyces sp. G1 TaxID=361572 RepID=UPI00202EE873|nr:hypothetical protein [Streptomyces sp. G1]MCM1977178.1 hypothetical protein [Streptomyces sp. G1]
MTTTTTATRLGPATTRVLRDDLKRITGRALSEVRITPARYDRSTVYCAMALDRQGREVPLPGMQRAVVGAVRRCFPDADWSRAQDYDVVTGILRQHVVRLPACLEGDDL